MNTCVSCRWWSVGAGQAALGDRGFGYCKRFPPTPHGSNPGVPQSLPQMTGRDWCGEHAAIVEPDPVSEWKVAEGPLAERLRLTANAMRAYKLFDAEGAEVSLSVWADQCDEASAALAATQSIPFDGVGELITDTDLGWLEHWLASQKEGGHCGEGNVERSARAAWNDRIERILAALDRVTPAEAAQ